LSIAATAATPHTMDNKKIDNRKRRRIDDDEDDDDSEASNDVDDDEIDSSKRRHIIDVDEDDDDSKDDDDCGRILRPPMPPFAERCKPLTFVLTLTASPLGLTHLTLPMM